MKSKKIGTGIFFAAFVLFVGAGEAFSIRMIPLRLNLNDSKREKYYFHKTNELLITQKTGGRTTKNKEKIEVGMIMDVNTIDSADNMVVDCNYVLLKMNHGTGKKQRVYDSSKKGPIPRIAKNFSKLLGQKFSMEITPTGKIKKFAGLKKIKEQITKGLPEGPNKLVAVKDIAKYLEPDSLRQWIEQVLAVYPGKIVDVNDTWKRESVVPHRYPIMTEDAFRLKDRKRRNLTIEVKSDIRIRPDAKPENMGFSTVSYEFKGTGEGLIEVREASGLIEKSTFRKKASGFMKMMITFGGESREIISPIEFVETTTLVMTRIEIEEPDEDDFEKAKR